MKKHNKPRNSSILMLELIIAILFFAIASAGCAQMFVKAQSLSRDANALSFAARECSNVAEMITSTEADAGVIEYYFDDSFAECSKGNASYTLVASIDRNDKRMLTAEIAAFAKDGKEIYSLDIVHNIRGEAKR